LARKKPVGWMIVSSSVRSAPAIARASGNRVNSAGVTRLTRLSVVCADSTVATSSWNGLVKSSSARASGYDAANARLILRARRTKDASGGVDAGGGLVTCGVYGRTTGVSYCDPSHARDVFGVGHLKEDQWTTTC
jgi:hypothetical protein